MTVARVTTAPAEVINKPVPRTRIAVAVVEVLRTNSDPPMPQPEQPNNAPVIMVVS